MKLLSKLFAVVFSLALLTGCGPAVSEPAPEAPKAPEVMEVETAEPESIESLDEEIDTLMEEEAAIDVQLDDLEAEGL